MNGPARVDCDVFVFVDSSGDSDNDRGETLSLRISLDKPEEAVLMVSEETTVDADGGESGMDIEIARACWSTSGLGCTYGLILPVLYMEGQDQLARTVQRLFDEIVTGWTAERDPERQFPATRAWFNGCGLRTYNNINVRSFRS